MIKKTGKAPALVLRKEVIAKLSQDNLALAAGGRAGNDAEDKASQIPSVCLVCST